MKRSILLGMSLMSFSLLGTGCARGQRAEGPSAIEQMLASERIALEAKKEEHRRKLQENQQNASRREKDADISLDGEKRKYSRVEEERVHVSRQGGDAIAADPEIDRANAFNIKGDSDISENPIRPAKPPVSVSHAASGSGRESDAHVTSDSERSMENPAISRSERLASERRAGIREVWIPDHTNANDFIPVREGERIIRASAIVSGKRSLLSRFRTVVSSVEIGSSLVKKEGEGAPIRPELTDAEEKCERIQSEEILHAEVRGAEVRAEEIQTEEIRDEDAPE